MLNSYFHPLNISNILQFALILFLFEAIGHYFFQKLNFPNSFRPLSWLIGLSAYVFVWFILHFFLPFNSYLTWIILFCLSAYPLFSYIKQKHFTSLFKSFLKFPYAFLAVLPLAKQFLFLLSKPPHRWDELHYQFFSPERLLSESSWSFLDQIRPYFFDMIPRFLSTSYVLMFSLTKTYATAQLLHFLLFLSALTSIGLVLKKYMNPFPIILFTVSGIYFYPELLQNATEGYVDSGIAILMLLTGIYLADYLTKPKEGTLYALTFLSGITLSIKYTAIPFLLGLIIAFLIQVREKVSKHFTKRRFLIMLGILLLTGGYWYLKNLIITGNPVYPYLFSCLHSIPCGADAPEMVGQYTIPFNTQNFTKIIEQITFKNTALFWYSIIGLVISIILSSVEKKTYIFKLSVIILISIGIDLLLNSYISGYQNRFFYHWNFAVSLFIFLPLAFLSFKSKIKTILSMGIICMYLAFSSSLWIQFNKGFLAFSQPGFYTGEDILYAKKDMSLETWLSFRFPESYKIATEFCNNQPKKTIYILDKYSYHLHFDGLIRAFFTNCQVIYLPNSIVHQNESSLDVMEQLLNEDSDQENYIFSLQKCDAFKEIEYPESYSKIELELNEATPKILCNLEKTDYKFLYKIN